jgi:general secretion pathway protein L
VRQFLNWWAGELRVLIPEPIRKLFGSHHLPLNVCIGPDAILIEEPSSLSIGRLPTIEAAPLPPALAAAMLDRPTVVLLPRAKVLRRTIELPLAAERELEAALAFEIDRQTPFAPDRVYRAFHLRDRDRERKVIRAELAVVERTIVDRALELIGSYGIVASAVTVEGDINRDFNFLPRRHSPYARSWRSEPWKPIVIAATILLTAGTAVQAWLVHAEALDLDRKVAAMRDVGRRGETVREAITSAIAAAHFLPERQAAPRAVEIVDALSQALPDDTWVFELELTEHDLRIAGFSTDVPTVIERLQQVALFETPQLRSPVVHMPGKNGDRFDLAVRVKRELP